MLSNSEAELRAELRRRSAAVKRDIQCACDAAFLRLRDKERQLLRVVDTVSSRQQGDLWAATLLRQQQQQQQQQQLCNGSGRASLPAVQTMSLSLDTPLLERAIEQFAAVRLDGAMTSASGVTSSSLPDGLEEYGAEEHLVSHKPLPGDPGSVRVTRPPALAAYSQYYPNRNLSYASSLTSSDEEEKFELIDGSADLVSSPFSKDHCGCVPQPSLDIESLYLMDCVSTPPGKAGHLSEEKMDAVSEEKLAVERCHPFGDSQQAWLLSTGNDQEDNVPPGPLAQWQEAMAADHPSPSADRHRWLLRQLCRANEPCLTPSDCVSDCAERAALLGLTDWRAGWLLGGAGRPPTAADQQQETAAVLAPFRQMEKNTSWVAARG